MNRLYKSIPLLRSLGLAILPAYSAAIKPFSGQKPTIIFILADDFTMENWDVTGKNELTPQY